MKSNKNQRSNSESIMKKSKARLGTSPRKSKKLALKKAVSHYQVVKDPSILSNKHPKQKSVSNSTTVNSSLDLTPESLSQISSIMPVDDSTMVSTFHKPLQTSADDTWVRAVNRARGDPDGAERSMIAKSPKTATKLKEIPEEFSEQAMETPEKNKENSHDKKNKDMAKRCLKVPLKQASRKLKSLKSKKALEHSRIPIKSKIKRKFDDIHSNEASEAKKAKAAWKEKKKERKMLKNNFILIQAAKGIWEELRRENITPERRKQLCKDLFSKVSGKIKELAMAHDSARFIQCLIKYGEPEHRTAVLEEIKDHIVDYCKSKYAKYIIRKLLKYGCKVTRAGIINAFHGSVRKMIRHKEASDIIEYAYNNFANAPQRLALLEEFYGPAFTMFKTNTSKSLDDVLKEQPDKRGMILHNLKDSLLPLIDKQILDHSMVHKIFHDFFQYADDNMRKDMIEALRESLIHMLHTRDGTRVAMACIWHGSAKDRKTIIKSLKGHVLKVCKEEAGHLLLLSIFDVVDDTVLVQKVILDEILRHLGEVVADSAGRKVLVYLLARRDQSHFCPDVIHLLETGDSNTTSKKDSVMRANELRNHVSKPLVNYVKENAKDLFANNNTSLFVPTIIAHATGDVTEVMSVIAQLFVESSMSGQNQNKGQTTQLSLVESPAGHIILKKLICNDKDRIEQGLDGLFSLTLLNTATPSTLKTWAATNRGCFILSRLLELNIPEVTDKLKAQLAPLKKSLKKMTFKGAEILLENLNRCSSGPVQPTRPAIRTSRPKIREICL